MDDDPFRGDALALGGLSSDRGCRHDAFFSKLYLINQIRKIRGSLENIPRRFRRFWWEKQHEDQGGLMRIVPRCVGINSIDSEVPALCLSIL